MQHIIQVPVEYQIIMDRMIREHEMLTADIRKTVEKKKRDS